jgi:flagellar biosynthesis GTPase FlhF
MTTPVSQTVLANTRNTKNTKGNRQVFVARYIQEVVYKLPDNLDLKDKTVVKDYWVKWNTLYIEYTSKEHFLQYYDGSDHMVIVSNIDEYCWVQKIQCYFLEFKEPAEIEKPDRMLVDDAEDYAVEYDDDENEEEEDDEDDEEDSDDEIVELMMKKVTKMMNEEGNKDEEEEKEKVEEKVEEDEEDSDDEIVELMIKKVTKMMNEEGNKNEEEEKEKEEKKEDNTKNTKNNRKIVIADWGTTETIYKIPNNLDLEDKNIVEKWWVQWNMLHIKYTNEENYIKYTGCNPEDYQHITQCIEPCNELGDHRPEGQMIWNAEDYDVDYTEDEEDE